MGMAVSADGRWIASSTLGDAVTMREPSELKTAEFTNRSWPRGTAIFLPVAVSQTGAVMSTDAVTMREPSGLRAAPWRRADIPGSQGARSVTQNTAVHG
jgi:hypothetical protein